MTQRTIWRRDAARREGNQVHRIRDYARNFRRIAFGPNRQFQKRVPRNSETELAKVGKHANFRNPHPVG